MLDDKYAYTSSTILSYKGGDGFISPEKRKAFHRWCRGCQKYHNGFWKTVINSPQWKAWEKHVGQKSLEDDDHPFYIPEFAAQGGRLSPKGFQLFLDFVENEYEEGDDE